jgi:hypothetical protein
MKSEKKCQLKKRKKNESTRLTCQTCNPGHEMGKTKKKIKSNVEGHEIEITSWKENKKNDLVKIPKLATLITRLRYPYGKQIKTDYEDQFPTDPI